MLADQNTVLTQDEILQSVSGNPPSLVSARHLIVCLSIVTEVASRVWCILDKCFTTELTSCCSVMSLKNTELDDV